MNYAMYAPPFAFFIYALFKYCRIWPTTLPV
jgi:hypothetical protein